MKKMKKQIIFVLVICLLVSGCASRKQVNEEDKFLSSFNYYGMTAQDYFVAYSLAYAWDYVEDNDGRIYCVRISEFNGWTVMSILEDGEESVFFTIYLTGGWYDYYTKDLSFEGLSFNVIERLNSFQKSSNESISDYMLYEMLKEVPVQPNMDNPSWEECKGGTAG